MRDFFKSELQTLKAKTGLNQFENMSAMPDKEKQFKILFDSLEMVCAEFQYIPDNDKKRIIQEQIIRDQDFTGLNSRVVWKWLNANKDHYWAIYQAKVEKQAQAQPVSFDQLPAHIQAEVNQFLASLASDGSGVKVVPSVSNEEIKAIQNEDKNRVEKPKSLIASNPRPKFKVGETCPDCFGTGQVFQDPATESPLNNPCAFCEGTGQINIVEIQAASLEEARKAYQATFG